MPRKRILVKSIDTSISYQVIGIDLAKHLVSACLITGAGEIFGIDRLTYDDLLKSAERMSPTLFCMEPCPEVHYLAEKLQGYGHHTKVIDGAAVKEYIKTHFGGQKTDLNDAQAIAFLSLDTNLPEITPKNTSNSVLSSIQAVREQFRKEYIQSFVSLKGICQRWGLPISKGVMNKNKVEELVSESKKIPQEVKDWLLELLHSCRELQKRLNKISKYLKEYADNDEICQKIMSVPGIGPITATRLKATIGDIQRFEKPKSIVAYYGLVPKSKATGHNEKKGGITRRGDRVARSLLIEGAGVVLNLAAKGFLRSKPLNKWIEKKRKLKMPWGKLCCALAAKMLRIVRAILIQGTSFNAKIAGVARCSLPKESRNNVMGNNKLSEIPSPNGSVYIH